MWAFMDEKLPKYARKKFIPNIKLILHYFKTNKSTFKLTLCNPC
jgi:hypothetical protein